MQDRDESAINTLIVALAKIDRLTQRKGDKFKVMLYPSVGVSCVKYNPEGKDLTEETKRFCVGYYTRDIFKDLKLLIEDISCTYLTYQLAAGAKRTTWGVDEERLLTDLSAYVLYLNGRNVILPSWIIKAKDRRAA